MSSELQGPGGSSLPPHVLVFPFPAQGHMIPLLDLAHLLSLHGLAVTVLVTPKNVPLLDPLLSRAPTIRTLVLPFPSHPSLPAGTENARGLPHHYFLSLKGALGGLREPILRWASSNPTPPDVIVSDFFLGWTKGVAADLGIPRLVFSPSCALTLSVMNCLWREMPKRGDPDDDAYPIAFPTVPGSLVFPWHHLSTIYRSYREGDPAWEFIKQGFLDNIASWGYVFNTFADLETPYLGHLRSDLGHPRVWAVGPLLPPGGADAAVDRGGAGSEGAASGVLGWLDACPEEGKVVYVCFGSQALLSQPQAEAVAAALERSGVRFVWGAGAAEVPEGFEERTAERGVVLRGWAPQVAILGHPAVGWFLTHCGWNSVLEGLAAGVALLAWPMTADQFMDARLLVDDIGVAIRACEGAGTVPDPAELGKMIAVAVGGQRPERSKALELRETTAAAVRVGGSSHRDLEELVGALWGLKRQEGCPPSSSRG
ncbi:hypothetical protein Taro_018548 [Colocasia esculenta]|uniref:Uncharacterized protein n=1 Tax=Colocasia esculenta TaxID=4460 RepID=A0A843UIZ4_COLES|nr:hypothetical protein [Colocasia esculenta]